MEKSDALIERLVSDLPNASPSRHWGARYLIYWMVWFALVGLVTYLLHAAWPGWLRPPDDLLDPGFVGKLALYLTATVVFARFAYLQSIPCREYKHWRGFAVGTALVLLGGVPLLSPLDPRGLWAEVNAELDWAVGPCGFFIAFTALAMGAAVRLGMRRGFAVDARSAGAWTFAATACLASVSMELLCRHESPTHMLIWHLVPLGLVVWLGATVSDRDQNFL